MTSDFKDKILKWLTGNYGVYNGDNTPQYSAVSSHANNLLSYIQSQVGPDGFFISSILQGNNADNQGLGYTIIAGYDATTIKGFLIILDEDFDPVQTIKTYSSGTEFGIFEILNVGDDGNFFGIETVNPMVSPVKRFVMLNNILAKLPTETDYQVVLRQSYNLPANIKDAVSYSNLIKAPGQAKYLIVGSIYNGSFQYQPIATELQVVVGSSNTWTEYRYAGTDDYAPTDCWASWDSGGNLSFKIVGFSYISGFYYCEYTKSGSALTRATIGPDFGSFPNTIGAIIINETTAYVSAGIINLTVNETNYIYKVDYSGSALTQIYSKTGPTVDGPNTSGIALSKFNDEVYYSVKINKDTTPTAFIKYAGRIVGTYTYEYTIGEVAVELSIDLFMVRKQFNLYNFYIQANNSVYATIQIYNPLNFNGLAYQALNSMVPNSTILYDENDIAIFARNLYNRVINNNTTIATIQIPNNFINDISIVLQKLLSETNNILVSSDQVIVKNIYEEILLNFINTLMIINENDPDNEIINAVGATRLNNSISNLKDYDSSKMAKYKINYSDNTSSIVAIGVNSLVYSSLSVTYLFTVYVPLDKTISNIQLISYDESTIYQTIDTSSFVGGKYYSISQKVEVI